MTRWSLVLPVLLVIVGTLAAAALTLWLGSNLVDRELRQSAVRIDRAEAIRVGGLMQAQLAAYVDELNRQQTTDGFDAVPAGLMDRLGRVRPHGVAAANWTDKNPVTGLLLVEPGSGRILDTTAAGIDSGQPLREPGATRALAHMSADPPRASWQIDANQRPLTAWYGVAWQAQPGTFAEPAEGVSDDVPRVLLIQVSVDRLARRAMAASTSAVNGETVPPTRVPVVQPAGVQSGAQSAAKAMAYSLRGVQPAMEVSMTAAAAQRLPTIAPLYGRSLLGAALVALLLSAVWWRFAHSTHGGGPANTPVPSRLLATVDAVRNNNFDTRSELSGADDPNSIAGVIDQLLDQRARLMQVVEQEREALTSSLDGLQQAVQTMASDLDFSVPLPPQDDATGRVADAVRNLTDRISQQLESLQAATSAVQDKMERIHERSAALAPVTARFDKQVNDQMTMMHRIESDLTRIVDAGHSTDSVVARGRVAAAGALEQARAVEQSLKTARYELRLTEKRIKTVAERSQEIGVLVRTIGDLAERTGILALNASLQAAATDSAGRQFAPIAQEVKRLADSAGQAVVQAERLVNAIREETGFAAQASATATSSVTALGKRISEHSVIAEELTVGIDALAEQLSGIDSLANRYRQDMPQANEGREQLLEVQATLSNLLGEQVGSVAELRVDVQQILRLASVMPMRTLPDAQPDSNDRPTDADGSSHASDKTNDGQTE